MNTAEKKTNKKEKKSNKKESVKKIKYLEVCEMERTEGQEADDIAYELAGCPDGWR
jgi:hypothetical protein